jgi:hypothetical protein
VAHYMAKSPSISVRRAEEHAPLLKKAIRVGGGKMVAGRQLTSSALHVHSISGSIARHLYWWPGVASLMALDASSSQRSSQSHGRAQNPHKAFQ